MCKCSVRWAEMTDGFNSAKLIEKKIDGRKVTGMNQAMGVPTEYILRRSSWGGDPGGIKLELI